MSDDTHLDRTDETSIGRVIRLDGNTDELEMTMKHDLGWVCDELA